MKTEAEIKNEMLYPFEQFVKIVLDNQESAHQEGYESGLEEMDDNYREKIGVDYAVEAFKECVTPLDFQEKYKELTNLACTFMPTLGLKRLI